MSVPAWTSRAPLPRATDRDTALRNFVWLSADKVVSVSLGLLVFGLIARHFGTIGAGQFSYGVAVLQATLGLSLVCSSAAVLPRLVRLSDGAAAGVVANVFAVRLGASFVAAAAVACYAVWAIEDPMRLAVTLVMVATVPLLEPFSAFSSFWISRNRNRRPVLARASGLFARLAVVAVALWADASPWIVAFAWVAEASVCATVQTLNLRGVRPASHFSAAVRGRRAARYFRYAVRFAFGLWLAQLFLRLDRLWLAERMDPHAFGLYATAMQLVEVWLNVATLMAGSMAPAFLYRALWRSTRISAHWRTLVVLALTGLAGLIGAVLLGRQILETVFGAAFAPGHAYLVAGFAAAVLFFIDQFVQISITATNRPGLLAAKWGAAAAAALATLVFARPWIGAFAGPLGMALGVLCGWCVVALWKKRVSPHPARRH